VTCCAIFFERMVAAFMAAGLIKGQGFAVDATGRAVSTHKYSIVPYVRFILGAWMRSIQGRRRGTARFLA
jgi:hypothetical protein